MDFLNDAPCVPRESLMPMTGFWEPLPVSSMMEIGFNNDTGTGCQFLISANPFDPFGSLSTTHHDVSASLSLIPSTASTEDRSPVPPSHPTQRVESRRSASPQRQHQSGLEQTYGSSKSAARLRSRTSKAQGQKATIRRSARHLSSVLTHVKRGDAVIELLKLREKRTEHSSRGALARHRPKHMITSSMPHDTKYLCAQSEVGRESGGSLVQCQSCDIWVQSVDMAVQTIPSIYICLWCSNIPDKRCGRITDTSESDATESGSPLRIAPPQLKAIRHGERLFEC